VIRVVDRKPDSAAPTEFSRRRESRERLTEVSTGAGRSGESIREQTTRELSARDSGEGNSPSKLGTSSVTGGARTRGAAPPPSSPQSDTRNDVKLSPVSWAPDVAMNAQRWAEHGRQLGRLGAGANWWVGDWVRYGNAEYGERYKLAAKITGYDPQTLMNCAHVASRFEVSQRRQDVSWSHHSELAALEPTEQQYWFERVVADRLSLKDLRRELRSARQRPRLDANEPPPAVHETESANLCPTCGRPLQRG
jgi:hypothetical protein